VKNHLRYVVLNITAGYVDSEKKDEIRDAKASRRTNIIDPK
jgi:hypothetical protein